MFVIIFFSNSCLGKTDMNLSKFKYEEENLSNKEKNLIKPNYTISPNALINSNLCDGIQLKNSNMIESPPISPLNMWSPPASPLLNNNINPILKTVNKAPIQIPINRLNNTITMIPKMPTQNKNKIGIIRKVKIQPKPYTKNAMNPVVCNLDVSKNTKLCPKESFLMKKVNK